MAQDPGRGTMLLVLGILSIVCCNFLGPVAWILGRGDLAKIRAGEISQEAEQMTKIGMILGIVGSCLLVLCFIAGCIFAIVAVFVLGAAGTQMKKGTMMLLEPFFGLLF
jgi:hypothetical protein